MFVRLFDDHTNSYAGACKIIASIHLIAAVLCRGIIAISIPVFYKSIELEVFLHLLLVLVPPAIHRGRLLLLTVELPNCYAYSIVEVGLDEYN